MQKWWKPLGQQARIDTWNSTVDQLHYSSSSNRPAKHPTGLRAWVCILGSQHRKFWVSARHPIPTRWDSEPLLRCCQCTLQRVVFHPGLHWCCLQDHTAPRQLLHASQAQGAHDTLVLYFLQLCGLILPSHKAQRRLNCFEVWQIWVTSS